MKKLLTIVTLSLAMGVFGSSIALAACNPAVGSNQNCNWQSPSKTIGSQPNHWGGLTNCSLNEFFFNCNLPSFPNTDRPVCPDAPIIPPVVNPEPNEPGKPDNPDMEEPNGGLNQQEAEVVRLVNEQRAAQGLAALVVDGNLQKAAKVRAQEQTQLFSHTRPNGTSCFTALAENGVSYMGAGENIAYGQSSAAEVMRSWMNSAGHKANIMSPDFTKIGVGCYQDGNGVLYWAQEFIYE